LLDRALLRSSRSAQARRLGKNNAHARRHYGRDEQRILALYGYT
jgi:hypothetical protein